MYSLTLEQFLSLTSQQRNLPDKPAKSQKQTEKVLLPNQPITPAPRSKHTRQLTTCSRCDAVVDASILHPWTSICPFCLVEYRYR
jgi:hypothetical protein